MINAVNKYHKTVFEENFASINVMRPSVLGNPFSIGKHGTREEVVSKYEVWLRDKIFTKDKQVCEALNRIWVQVKTGKTVYLECCCFPKLCHADVIVKIIQERL